MYLIAGDIKGDEHHVYQIRRRVGCPLVVRKRWLVDKNRRQTRPLVNPGANVLDRSGNSRDCFA